MDLSRKGFEQGGFMCEAIDEALATYTGRLKAAERQCLRCSARFQSGGVGNRLCERCAEQSTVETARIA